MATAQLGDAKIGSQKIGSAGPESTPVAKAAAVDSTDLFANLGSISRVSNGQISKPLDSVAVSASLSQIVVSVTDRTAEIDPISPVLARIPDFTVRDDFIIGKSGLGTQKLGTQRLGSASRGGLDRTATLDVYRWYATPHRFNVDAGNTSASAADLPTGMSASVLDIDVGGVPVSASVDSISASAAANDVSRAIGDPSPNMEVASFSISGNALRILLKRRSLVLDAGSLTGSALSPAGVGGNRIPALDPPATATAAAHPVSLGDLSVALGLDVGALIAASRDVSVDSPRSLAVESTALSTGTWRVGAIPGTTYPTLALGSSSIHSVDPTIVPGEVALAILSGGLASSSYDPTPIPGETGVKIGPGELSTATTAVTVDSPVKVGIRKATAAVDAVSTPISPVPGIAYAGLDGTVLDAAVGDYIVRYQLLGGRVVEIIGIYDPTVDVVALYGDNTSNNNES